MVEYQIHFFLAIAKYFEQIDKENNRIGIDIFSADGENGKMQIKEIE